MPIRKMAGNLFVRRINHRNAAVPETLQRRITKAATQGKHLGYTLFPQGSRKHLTTANFHFFSTPRM
jgi:hypothetical protein